jgi:hypothetical protein
MSREAELHKLAQVCYSQANATLSRATKQALREMGDHYEHEAKHEHEAKRLREQAPSESRRPQLGAASRFVHRASG